MGGRPKGTANLSRRLLEPVRTPPTGRHAQQGAAGSGAGFARAAVVQHRSGLSSRSPASHRSGVHRSPAGRERHKGDQSSRNVPGCKRVWTSSGKAQTRWSRRGPGRIDKRLRPLQRAKPGSNRERGWGPTSIKKRLRPRADVVAGCQIATVVRNGHGKKPSPGNPGARDLAVMGVFAGTRSAG